MVFTASSLPKRVRLRKCRGTGRFANCWTLLGLRWRVRGRSLSCPCPCARGGVRYRLWKSAYLNFIAQDRVRRSRIPVEGLDAAYNALEFRGPETIAELNRLREETFKRLSRSFEPENDL
jgi:hypothetical protein